MTPAKTRDGDESVRQRELIQKLSLTFHGLSHDLREPIRTSLCYGEILGGNSAVQDDPNLTECVHFISGAAQRIEVLVSGLLDYSRLLGEQPHPRAVVDMNLIVQTALANLQMQIEESAATVVNDSSCRRCWGTPSNSRNWCRIFWPTASSIELQPPPKYSSAPSGMATSMFSPSRTMASELNLRSAIPYSCRSEGSTARSSRAQVWG